MENLACASVRSVFPGRSCNIYLAVCVSAGVDAFVSQLNGLHWERRWWQQVLKAGRVCVCVFASVCAWQLNNCSVGDNKKADGFGSTLSVQCVCVREWMFVSHHYLDLDFPKAAWKALNLLCVFLCAFCLCVVCVCVCVCQERKVRRWSWRMWSFISVSVCHASRTTAPSPSFPPTARASSCPTASTLQWVGHADECLFLNPHTPATYTPRAHFLFVSQ